jgi:hypothetical protein
MAADYGHRPCILSGFDESGPSFPESFAVSISTGSIDKKFIKLKMGGVDRRKLVKRS